METIHADIEFTEERTLTLQSAFNMLQQAMERIANDTSNLTWHQLMPIRASMDRFARMHELERFQ